MLVWVNYTIGASSLGFAKVGWMHWFMDDGIISNLQSVLGMASGLPERAR
jgi:hypothetical protein